MSSAPRPTGVSATTQGKILLRADLEAEIARRAPWYQRIEFPDQKISTTDNPKNAILDPAWDNRIGDISAHDAAVLRPLPKWQVIRDFIPSIADAEVLEVGTSNGFFALEFAKQGAKRVIGLDIYNPTLDNARWAASVLGLNTVEFINTDFMAYSGRPGDPPGLLGGSSASIPLPINTVDIVFSSTVIDHMFFPFMALYKMLRMARRYVVLDIPVHAPTGDNGKTVLTLDMAEDGTHHGFFGQAEFWTLLISRLGIRKDDIKQNIYNDGRNLCLVIQTHRHAPNLWGA